MWQDILLGGANWILLVSLLPSIVSKEEKPALASSIITGVCLLAIAFSYYSLGLLQAAIPASLVGIQWFILGYQRARINRARGEPLFTSWK